MMMFLLFPGIVTSVFYFVSRDIYATIAHIPIGSKILEIKKEAQESVQEIIEKGDPHLRSMKEVMGYHIHTTTGEIGHVEDFLMEDETWKIHYMVVNTRNWLPGRKVLISPIWITGVNWAERQVAVFLSQEDLKDSPEYSPTEPVSQEYEDRFFKHYGSRGPERQL
jgi:hypothetical protein